MRRAGDVFALDEWGCDSALVEKVWATDGSPEAEFISVAESHWQIVISDIQGRKGLSIRGPSTHAVPTPIPPDAEFFGIVLRLGTHSPAFPLAGLVDGAVEIPGAARGTALLDNDDWEIPTLDNADVFVARLERAGLLVRDRLVADAVLDEAGGLGTRTVQRRVAQATGLTRGMIRQISRADAAVRALGRGLTPAQTAASLEFADQPHLTRSLRRFIGQTPGQLTNDGPHWSASSPLEARMAREA
jgi:AraC-like DNA-binding protein